MRRCADNPAVARVGQHLPRHGSPQAVATSRRPAPSPSRMASKPRRHPRMAGPGGGGSFVRPSQWRRGPETRRAPTDDAQRDVVVGDGEDQAIGDRARPSERMGSADRQRALRRIECLATTAEPWWTGPRRRWRPHREVCQRDRRRRIEGLQGVAHHVADAVGYRHPSGGRRCHLNSTIVASVSCTGSPAPFAWLRGADYFADRHDGG